VSHWEDTRLDRAAIEAMMRAASPEQVALCIQSYSSTSTDDIHPRRLPPALARAEPRTGRSRR